jgi:hypothetical protein
MAKTERQKAMARADKYFSQYIRFRDTPCFCPTCGAYITYETSDCCHYIGRGHLNTRYSEMNCHAGCRKCNRFKSGEAVRYRMWLVEKYGEQKVQELERLAFLAGGGFKSFDLDMIADQYKQKIKALKAENNL